MMFKELINCSIGLSYYDSMFWSNIEFVPLFETARELKSMGMIARQKNGKLIIAAESKEFSPETFRLKLPWDNPNKALHFGMFLKSPSDLGFVETPNTLNNSKTLYFSNVGINNALHLCQNTITQKVGSSDVYPVYHKSFSLDIDEAVKSELNIKLRHLATNQELELRFNVDSNAAKARIHIPLEKLPIGLIALRIEDVLHSTFLNLLGTNNRSPFAIISLYKNDLVENNYRFINDDGAISAKEYTINFSSRSTYWRYIIINQSEKDLSKATIKHNVLIGPKEFEDITDTGSWPDNVKVFISTEAIPLTESGLTKLEFYDDIDSSTPIIRFLPMPGAQNTTVDSTDTSKFISDIYIYI